MQRSEQSRALAQRQYYPDFNVAFQRFQNFQANDGFGAYVAMSIPFAFWTKPKYDAGVQEAAAAVAVAQAQQHTLENLTRFQINDLLAKLRATDQVATLYRTTILPQARAEPGSRRASGIVRGRRVSWISLTPSGPGEDFSLSISRRSWTASIDWLNSNRS